MPHFEAELPLVIADVFAGFPIGDFVISVNNRKIANGFYHGIGLTDVMGTLRILDKLDKIGAEGVTSLLTAAGATPDQISAALGLASIRTADLGFVDEVRALGVTHPLLEEGLSELTAVMTTALAHAPGRVVANLRIARGLDYYTGTVYETHLVGRESWGSICSGGRYDALASDGRTTYPGVGISIGVTRILGLLLGSGLLRGTRSTPAVVLIALADEATRADATAIATALRARGIPCEVAPNADKFGKQIRYADRRGIPHVWFSTADGEQVKDIRSGVQVAADPATWTPPAADLRPGVERPGGTV